MFQIKLPRVEKIKNILTFILTLPAGKDIIDLMVGTILPKNIAATSYFSKKIAALFTLKPAHSVIIVH